MPLEDEPDPEQQHGQGPPPPDDRLWRHPAELAGGLAPPSAWSAPPAPPRSRWRTPAALAGVCLAGVCVVAGALWLSRPVPGGDRDQAITTSVAAPTRPAAFGAGSGGDALDLDRVAEAAEPSLAVVQVQRDGTWTTTSAVWTDQRGTLAAATVALAGADRVVVIDRSGRRHAAQVAGRDGATGITAITTEATGRAATASGAPLDDDTPAALVASDSTGRGVDATPAGTDAVLATVAGADERAVVGSLVLHGATLVEPRITEPAQSDRVPVGAAVVDHRGHLIAMSVGATDAGLVAAVDGATVVEVAADLRDHGEVRRAWLGVQATDAPAGAQITEVTWASPAAIGGLQVDDVVTAVDGRPVADASDLVLFLRHHHPGDTSRIEVQRAGRTHHLTVTLGG